MIGDRPRRAVPPRRTAVLLAGALLALVGIMWLANSGILAVMPPVLDEVNPPLSMAIGVAFLAAALGVFGLLPWGRWLGIMLGVAQLAHTAVSGPYAVAAASAAPAADPASAALVSLVLPAAVAALILFGLVFRWPAQGGDPLATD